MNTKEILQGIKNWTTSKLGGKVDKTTTVNGHALSGNVTVSKSDVGLGNVTNDAQVTRAEMGAASGVATLDTAGKVPSSQLPSYVDDVLEYDTKSAFPTTGETGKIYVDKTTNKTWRWGGTDYVEISQSLALGETSSTAYAGDKGKALADKLATIEIGAEANVQSDWNATEGDAFIKNKPTNVSAFTNDAGYLTKHQSLDNYYDKDETDGLLDDKQDTLVSGTNIKTINSQSLLGSGNIEITGNTADVNYDTTNKKITKTINGVTSDVVTAETLVTDGGAAIEPEVEIGETAPTGTPKLFVDEDADPEVSIDVYTRTQTDTMLAGKVDKVTGKGLSTNDYTTDEKNKLAGIAAGAEVNVQSDWNATSGDAQILNKPTSLPASDVSEWAKASTKPSYTLDEVSDGSTRKLADYLPLSGGTLSASDRTVLSLESTHVYGPQLTFNSGSAILARICANTDYIGLVRGYQELGIVDDGIYYSADGGVTTHIIYHSGNFNPSNYLPLTGGTLTGRLNINCASSVTTAVIFDGTASGIGSNGIAALVFGKADSRNSKATLLFHNVSSGSNSNWLGLGFYENDDILNVQGSGNVGIGTTSPSYKLHVDGSVGATAFTNTSDIRKKDIIENLDLDVKDIANAPIFKFSWLDPEMPEGVNVGTSAQYWQTIIPEIVSEANDDEKTLSMQYGVAGLASSIALARKVVEQENTIKAQEARIKALEDAIAEIQNKLK